jgi:hypothetical protein
MILKICVIKISLNVDLEFYMLLKVANERKMHTMASQIMESIRKLEKIEDLSIKLEIK